MCYLVRLSDGLSATVVSKAPLPLPFVNVDAIMLTMGVYLTLGIEYSCTCTVCTGASNKPLVTSKITTLTIQRQANGCREGGNVNRYI